MSRVSVVIPTWNGWALLAQALDSLEAQTFRDFETIVVDNGSTDETADELGRNFPAVKLVALPENRGFAAAVNEGIAASTAEIVVLMNNDAVADPGWLGALVCALDENPTAGAVASKMLSYSDPSIIDSAGDELGLLAYAIGHGERDGVPFARPREVFSACAGAAAYRRAALDDVGGFDERFFAYLEDVDLGARIRLAGWSCLYAPDAVVLHHGSATARKMPDTKLYLLLRNSLYVFFQNMPPRLLLGWAPVMLAWPFLRAAREGRPPTLAARAVGAFLRDLPAVARHRRSVGGYRRISWKEFRRHLADPVYRRHPNRRDEE